MATFPSIEPLYNTQETVKQDFITVQLGDGYRQRIIEGLPANKRLITLQLKFDLSQTDADTINTFLDARFDASEEAFEFTRLNNKYSGKKFICVRRTSTFPLLSRVKMNLTLEEVAEP